MNVPWLQRMARKNASLGVNEMWWMLLCRVIYPLGAQWLWVLSFVSGALLDYAWVIFGQQNLGCFIQECYWNLHVRGTLWQQDPQAPKPCTKRSPYQVQKNLLSADRTIRDMWCRADHKGVVRGWQRSIQSGSPGVGDLLLVVDSVAKVGFSSKLVQVVRLTMDMRPSLLQTVVAFASGRSRNRSDAEVLKGVMALFGEAQSVDEGVLAEFTGLHLRRRDDQMVSKAAARVPGELTSKVRAVLAAAAAQSGVLSVSLAHLRLLPSLDEGHSCPLSSSMVVKILGLAVETEILSRVATELARQQETRVFKHVDNLVHAGAHMSVPQLFRDRIDVCDALSKGSDVAGRQTAAGRYALFIVQGRAKEGESVSAIGFFEKWQMEVVECLTGRKREGVDAVMPRNPPAWRSVAEGVVTGVRCLAGLWVGDLWSSKHVCLIQKCICRFGGDCGHKTYR